MPGPKKLCTVVYGGFPKGMGKAVTVSLAGLFSLSCPGGDNP